MSQRGDIIAALRARVSTIRKADGYATDGGLKVFVSESPDLGPDDPMEAIAIVPLDAEPDANRMETWPIEVHALVKADLDEPVLSAFAILEDVVRAMELSDRTLGGLVKHIEMGTQRTLEREAGSTTIGVMQSYRLSRVREWGTP